MTSREWARQLRQTANVLDARPEVEMRGSPTILAGYYGDKEAFLNVVRALKPGRKKVDDMSSAYPYVNFYPAGTCIQLYINRDAVCRKIQDVKYECEPLLSPEEDAEMDVEANVEALPVQPESDIPF